MCNQQNARVRGLAVSTFFADHLAAFGSPALGPMQNDTPPIRG